MDLINGFSSEGGAIPLSESRASSVEQPEVFRNSNDYVGGEAELREEVRHYLKFPGINRFQMP